MPFDPISLAVYAGLTLASQAIAVRQNRKKISDIEFPTDDQRRKIPYIVGTAKLPPHVGWWGDFKRSPINLDIPLAFGLFGGGIGVLILWLLSRIPFGYRYYIGMALNLCYGPGVRLRKIECQGHTVFEGTVTGGSFTIDKPGEFGAEGGLFAVCDFVPGSMTQLRNPYLNSQVPNVPAFRGTATIYWRGPSSLEDAPTGDASAFLNEVRYNGYIGRSTIVKEMLMTVDRFPDNLGVSEFSVIRDVHGNYAETIYELLTDFITGLGMSTALIDTERFADVAEQLFDEELGCSFKWEEPTEYNDIITRLLETIEGVLYSDLATGKIVLELIRPVDPETLPLVTDKQAGVEFTLEVSDPNNSVGEVRIPYFDVEKNTEATGLAQSISNRTRNNAPTSITIELLGIGDADAANRAATREWAQLVEPPKLGTLRANRELYEFHVGSAFRLTWEPYRIEEEVWRVVEIDHGTLENGAIEMKVALDRAPSSDAQLGAVVSTLWNDPLVANPPNPTDGALRRVVSTTTTAPPASPEVGDRYWIPAGATGAWSGQTGFATWNGTEWIFEPTDESTLNPFLNEDDGQIYFWDGTTLQVGILTAYNTVQEEGFDLPRRTKLNFIGAGVTAEDDEDNDRTNVTIALSTSEVANIYDDILIDPTTMTPVVDPISMTILRG
jgi:uncharacterized protein DUF2793